MNNRLHPLVWVLTKRTELITRVEAAVRYWELKPVSVRKRQVLLLTVGLTLLTLVKLASDLTSTRPLVYPGQRRFSSAHPHTKKKPGSLLTRRQLDSLALRQYRYALAQQKKRNHSKQP